MATNYLDELMCPSSSDYLTNTTNLTNSTIYSTNTTSTCDPQYAGFKLPAQFFVLGGFHYLLDRLFEIRIETFHWDSTPTDSSAQGIVSNPTGGDTNELTPLISQTSVSVEGESKSNGGL